MRLRKRGVDDFRAVFLAHFKCVDFGGAEMALEFPLGRKDEDAARCVGSDVDVSGFINHQPAVAGTLWLIAGLAVKKCGDAFVFQLSRESAGGEKCEDSE